MNNLRLRTAMATALLLIAGVWTVGARAENAKQLEKKEGGWVPIIASTNSPVADADVVVSRENGKVLFEKARATNARGFYPAKLHRIPKKFRVTVTWEAQAPYQSLGLVSMSTDVHDYDPVNGRVYVNPVTTLVSRLLDRRPELSLARAQAIVRFVLGMPANASLGAALREGEYYRSPLFSDSEFLKQAMAYGSLDGFLENLVTQVIYHPNERHLFRAQNTQLGGIAGSAAQFVAKQLALGALKYASGQGVGWATAAVNKLEPNATKEQIEQMQAQLESLQSSVDALHDQLSQSTAQIVAAVDFTAYNTVATAQLGLEAQVDDVAQNVTDLADACPPSVPGVEPGDAQYCANLQFTVTSQLNESVIESSFGQFQSALVDSGGAGTRGMLHSFSLCTGETVGHFFRYGDSVKIQDMWDYWYAAEVQAANVKVELWHWQGAQNASSGQKKLLNFLGDANATPPTDGDMQNALNAEGTFVFPILPQGEIVNTDDKSIWMTTYPGSTSLPTCKFGLSSPPNGQGGASTGPELGSMGNGLPVIPYPGDPQTTWYSPFSEQLSSLIKGFAYKPVGTWLQIETSTKPGDPPGVPSIGFADVSAVTSACTVGPWVWTKTLVDSNSAQNYVVFNFNDGGTQPTNSSVGKLGNYNWVFLVSQFKYQYYWYN